MTTDWKEYAGKEISKSNLTREKNKQYLLSEINTQKSINHPKIVKVQCYSEDDSKVYIVQELCKNRSLHDLIKKRKLSEIEVQSYMFQIIQGVKFLHDKCIIHRDLKPSNIFLDEKYQIKIGDFGLIATIEKSKERRFTQCGTPSFMAPEIINLDKKKGYSYEVDIWSIGIIMYNLLYGECPFDKDAKNHEDIYNNILNKDIKDILAKEHSGDN